MRVILSRKGFDSTYGGMPSPILPDNKILSLPIPSKRDITSYSELTFGDTTLDKIIAELSEAKKFRAGRKWHNITPNTKCHLDPDIYPELKLRPKSWRPLFGQRGMSQSHLDKHRVGKGDLFLFFGWFRRVQVGENGYRYVTNAPDLHVIYGYLQVNCVVRTPENLKSWMKDHPHYQNILSNYSNDTIFVARERLSFEPTLPGAGRLPFSETNVLTQMGHSRSRWKLPEYLRNTNISFHSDASWCDDFFQSASRGQEFVFQETEESESWAKAILGMHSIIYHRNKEHGQGT